MCFVGFPPQAVIVALSIAMLERAGQRLVGHSEEKSGAVVDENADQIRGSNIVVESRLQSITAQNYRCLRVSTLIKTSFRRLPGFMNLDWKEPLALQGRQNPKRIDHGIKGGLRCGLQVGSSVALGRDRDDTLAWLDAK
mmetsp:Transcript_12901/g.22120  ORF Transcript_12901/g.22120 Transcript_12901/m.22120 type:complete len:139 (-) Transcript_12901:703-1119(-)